MKKLNSDFFFAGVFFLAFLHLSTLLFAQQRSLDRELLVYIMPDSLEMADGIAAVALQNASVKSSALAANLQKTRAISIAKAFPDWQAKDSIQTRKDGTSVKVPSFHRIFKLTFATKAEADSALKILNNSAAVLYAEKHSAPVLDNDQFYIDGTQWYLNNDGRNGGVAGADINAEGAWAIFTGSPDITIAIIDSGVDTGHEDLTGKSSGEMPFGNPHGTLVAGVAAARAFNQDGIRGVDWNAQILSKTIFNSFGQWLGDAAVGQKITDAVDEGADIVNCSWSFPDYPTTLGMAFAYAYKMDRVSVATMGNTSAPETRYPGAFNNVIAVGATQNNDIISDFSTTGNHIDVVAPGGTNPSNLLNGRDIWSTSIGDNYQLTSGTSFAAPQVAGLASLLKGFNNDLSNDDIRQIIRLTAEDDIVPGPDPEYGFGRINAGQALEVLQAPNELLQWSQSGGAVVNTVGIYQTQFYSASGLADGTYLVKRHEVQNTITFPQQFCEIAGAWGRGVGTVGWNAGTPNYGEGFCELMPGTLTNQQATFRTYVYEVVSILGQTLGWYPTTPANVTFAYSVLGIPGPNTTITGDFPPGSCNNSTQIFTLSNPSGGTAQTWSVSNGLQIVGSNTGTFVTVRVTGNGNQWIQASITNMCNTQTNVSKTVSVGIPQLTVSTYDDRTPQPSNYTYHTATAVQVPGTVPSNYRWFQEVNGVPTTQIATGLQLNRWPIPPCTTKYYQLQVTTACGTALYRGYAYNYYGCGSMYTVYPNPATERLIVEMDSSSINPENISEQAALSLIQNQPQNNENDIEYVLHNWFGIKVLSIKSKALRTEIDISRLPEGIYHLSIINGVEKIHTQHIVISK